MTHVIIVCFGRDATIHHLLHDTWRIHSLVASDLKFFFMKILVIISIIVSSAWLNDQNFASYHCFHYPLIGSYAKEAKCAFSSRLQRYPNVFGIRSTGLFKNSDELAGLAVITADYRPILEYLFLVLQKINHPNLACCVRL